MSLPRERPAFVLPWIGVVLASFASLPLLFGGDGTDGGTAVGVPGQPAGLLAGEQMGPQQAPSPLLEVDGSGFLPASAATGREDVATLAGWEPEGGITPVEAEPEGVEPEVLPEAPAEAAPVDLPESLREPAMQRLAPGPVLVAADRTAPAGRATGGAGVAPAVRDRAAEVAPLMRMLDDGRTELRLSPAAFTFLASRGLLPRGAEVQPAVLAERDLPRLRAEAEALEEEASGQRVAAERRARLKRVKRLLASDPGRLVEFLAVLEPAELRALLLALRGNGMSVDRLLEL